MAILPIITYPNKILETKTKEISDIKNPEIKELIFNMLETLEANRGLGLAANQVGKSLRLCIIKFEGKTHILINPKIKNRSWKKTIFEEGCLSFPGLYFPVKRYTKITIEAQDRKGNKFLLRSEGMLSRALQHEIDHLDGIVFISRKVSAKSKLSVAKNK
jgi:peptide deformylase